MIRALPVYGIPLAGKLNHTGNGFRQALYYLNPDDCLIFFPYIYSDHVGGLL